MFHKFIDKISKRSMIQHVFMDQYAETIEALPPLEVDGESLEIRLARQEDMATLVDLEQSAYDGYLPWTGQDFQNDWKKNPYCMYILIEHTATGQVIGMISGRLLAKGAHISHLIVAKEYQGHGLGTQLLQLWIQIVEQQAIPKITLEVRQSNIIAQNLYRQHGFDKEKSLPYYYYDNDETAYYLCRYSQGDQE